MRKKNFFFLGEGVLRNGSSTMFLCIWNMKEIFLWYFFDVVEGVFFWREFEGIPKKTFFGQVQKYVDLSEIFYG